MEVFLLLPEEVKNTSHFQGWVNCLTSSMGVFFTSMEVNFTSSMEAQACMEVILLPGSIFLLLWNGSKYVQRNN